MSANIEQIKAMLERAGKTNLLQKQEVDFDKEYLQLQQEQPEVDSLIRSELPDMEDDKSLGLCYCNQFGNHRITSKDVREIARHFYELGLNARKEN